LLFSRTAASFFIPAIFHVMQILQKKHDKKIKFGHFSLSSTIFSAPNVILFYFILVWSRFKLTIILFVLFKFLPNGFFHTKHKSEINTLVPWQLFLTQKNYVLFVEMLKLSFFLKKIEKKHTFLKLKKKNLWLKI
jgi:hypothetical protein